MNIHSWKDYWKQCKIDENELSNGLTALMKFPGWHTNDSLLYVSENQWLEYVSAITRKLSITQGSSVYEVGCGTGALLYPMYKDGIEVGGCDVCPDFVDAARTLMPSGSFEVKEAAEMGLGATYDFVISNSVFPLFPDLAYTEKVVTKMVAKAKKGIAIMDINDLAKKELYQQILQRDDVPVYYEQWWSISLEESNRLRRAVIEKEWLIELLENLGLDVAVEDQFLGHTLSEVRFNVYGFK